MALASSHLHTSIGSQYEPNITFEIPLFSTFHMFVIVARSSLGEQGWEQKTAEMANAERAHWEVCMFQVAWYAWGRAIMTALL